MDALKKRIADAAKRGAHDAVLRELGLDYTVEVVTDEPLLIQFRVRDNHTTGRGPRYFTVKVAEPI